MQASIRRVRAWETKDCPQDPLAHAHVSPRPLSTHHEVALSYENDHGPAHGYAGLSSVQAIKPWNGPRKGSLQYGDLSNIRPRSPSFEIPSPSVSPDRSASPREYAEATDPYSPRNRKEHGPQIEPRPVTPHRDKLTDASNQSNPPSYPRCGRKVAQPPQYELDSVILSPRQRGPTSPPRKSEYVPIEGLAHGFAAPADVYCVFIKSHGAKKSQTGVREGYRDWNSANGYTGSAKPRSVRQLDVCTIWRSLPPGLAEVIYLLDSVVTQCLESILQNELQAHRHQFQELSHYQNQLHSPHNRVPVAWNDIHKIEFSYEALVARLLDHIIRPCSMDPDMLEEMRDLTLLYLLSLDCFENVPSKGHVDTAITLDLITSESAAPGAALPTMVACVVPKMDTLSFQDLRPIISEGETLRIVPRYRRGATLKPYDNFTKLSYELYPPLPWLQWDDNLEGFQGKIPAYSLCAGHPSDLTIEPCRETWAALSFLKFEVLAVLEEFHPYSSLSLRRILRAQIKYQVLPQENRRAQRVSPRRLQHPIDLPYRDVKYLPRHSIPKASYRGREFPLVFPQEGPSSPQHSKTLPYRFSPSKHGRVCRKSTDCFPRQDEDHFAPMPPGYSSDLNVFYMGGVDTMTAHHHANLGRGYTNPRMRHRDTLRSNAQESSWVRERPHCTTPQPMETGRPPSVPLPNPPSSQPRSPCAHPPSPRTRAFESHPFPSPVPTPPPKHTRPSPAFPSPPARVVERLDIDDDNRSVTDVSSAPSVRDIPGMLSPLSPSRRARAKAPAREPLEPAASSGAADADDSRFAIGVASIAEPRAILRSLSDLQRMLADENLVGDRRAEVLAAHGFVKRAERIKRTKFRWSEETYGLESEASSLGLESGSPSEGRGSHEGSGARTVVTKRTSHGEGSSGSVGRERGSVARGTQTRGGHARMPTEVSCTEVEMADYMTATGSLRKRAAAEHDEAGEASNEGAGGEVLGVRVQQRQGRKAKKAKRKARRSAAKGSPVRSEK